MWALDLGTTNTVLARWDPDAERPVIAELPAVSRPPAREALEAPRVVPSAVQVIGEPSFWARLGQKGVLARRLFLGKLAEIGQPALERNRAQHRPGFVPSWKRALGISPLLTLTRTGGRVFTAREVARLFLRELLAAHKAQTGARIRELVVTSPVESFESYRAELQAIGRQLGLTRLRFLDEPVAAALGYGLGLTRTRRVLVVDMGGGTLHMAALELRPEDLPHGTGRVLAKAGRDVGGNLVDGWLLDALCQRLGYELPDDGGEEARLWRQLMLAEACRVKEALHFEERATFEVSAPEHLRRFEARLQGEARELELTRAELVKLLEARGLYRELEGCLAEVVGALGGSAELDDVLMVGGSTLLPQVYPMFEARFGRGRVRAWQPFEAVAYGAAVFAAGRVEPADFLIHDYALLTYDARTSKPEHTVVVPRGTRFPTPPDLWKRQLVPTCSLGEPERLFKLVICEIGSGGPERTFTWDAAGQLHKLGGAQGGVSEQVVVKLNEANPTLGYLDPPHSPRDSRPRLEVSFGVNAERWLCATVLDLHTHKLLMKGEPVVRLL